MKHLHRVSIRSLIVGCAALLGTLGALPAGQAKAESYIAPQFGVNFADRLSDVRGTGQLQGLSSPNFDLQNSLTAGVKIGHYFQNNIFGIEVDVLHSTPHGKNLDDIPGFNQRIFNIGVHLLARYPGKTFQPYFGVGPAILVSRIHNFLANDSPRTLSADSEVTVGVNVLLGIRAFVTPYVAVFTEYKYTDATPHYSGAFNTIGGFRADYTAQQLVFGVSYHF
ncbi:MAG: outer membrane beta-barrel protein [Nitrospiraceae bacterium]